ncbi:TPA: hypothetical protein HA361_03560, partial [Candidatus Woesearchaeota archaeon]|nr:hypothetical protein [Candidatus Woesearchaeota archaeon]
MGEKNSEERKEEKKAKTKKAPLSQTIASVLSAAQVSIKGKCLRKSMAEFTTSGFAAQTKEGGKIKGWDEKEAIGNELLGNAFLGNDAKCTLQRGRQRQSCRLHDGEVLRRQVSRKVAIAP